MPTSSYSGRKVDTFNKKEQKDALTSSWETWRAKPTIENFSQLLQQAKPTLNSAVRSYAPASSPSVYSMAKVYAKKAFETYDPTKGTKLKTYLHTQLQPLRREVSSYNTLHVPENVQSDIRYLNTKEHEFERENGRMPNNDELADFTKLSRKRIEHIRKFSRPTVYTSTIEESAGSEDAHALPATQEAESFWKDYVYDSLSAQDKLIYDLRSGSKTGNPVPLKDIAKKLRMSASAVSQRLKRIAAKIQEGAEYAEESR